MPRAQGETPGEKRRKSRSAPAPFKALLFLTILNIFVGGFGDFHPFLRTINLWLIVVTLTLALRASKVDRRFTLATAVLGLVIAALWQPARGHHRMSEVAVLLFFNLLTALAPIAILGKIRKEYSAESVDAEVVLGALCAYLYIGSWFSVCYRSIALLGKTPFFAQPGSEKMLNYIYFSFTTLTTTGFGDLSPAYGPGRMLAVIEAVIGQFYLVSVVAIVVSAFRKRL